MQEVIKDEMLKKYEENVYLLGRIFSNEPVDASDDSVSASENEDKSAEGDVDMSGDPEVAAWESRLAQLAEERKGLEAEYQKIFTEQQSLEKYQDEELDSFENSNKDFHQLLHSLKQGKLKFADIDNCSKKAKELGVFADTHPALLALDGQTPRQSQRPFTDTDHIEYLKI